MKFFFYFSSFNYWNWGNYLGFEKKFSFFFYWRMKFGVFFSFLFSYPWRIIRIHKDSKNNFQGFYLHFYFFRPFSSFFRPFSSFFVLYCPFSSCLNLFQIFSIFHRTWTHFPDMDAMKYRFANESSISSIKFSFSSKIFPRKNNQNLTK